MTAKLAFDLWAAKKPTSSPILFLHGIFGSKSNSRSVARVLARDLNANVYCLDLRNHGESPHLKTHTYPAMAADVREFISHHKLENPVVVGHSMGARVGMALALETPNVMSKLIAVDNSPLTTTVQSNFPRYIQGMQKLDVANINNQKDALKLLEPYINDVNVRLFLMSNFKQNEDGVYKCRIPLDILYKSLGFVFEFDYPASQYRFTKPALFIRGTESDFVPDEALPLIGQLFPRFVVSDVKAGHWVISENPQGFLDATKRFLDTSE